MKKQQKLFYKVFTKVEDKLVSPINWGFDRVIQPDNDDKYGLDYSTLAAKSDGYITAPRNTRFFLFETLEQAKKFVFAECYNFKYIVKAVTVKGGYAKNCKGVAVSWLLNEDTAKNIRKEFWNKVQYFRAKKVPMSEACVKAAVNINAPNSRYLSVFARHIKVLPDEVYSYEQE